MQAIVDASRAINSNAFVLCHGGPISMPEDAQFMLKNAKALDGFYSASSIERLPTKQVKALRILKFKYAKLLGTLKSLIDTLRIHSLDRRHDPTSSLVST